MGVDTVPVPEVFGDTDTHEVSYKVYYYSTVVRSEIYGRHKTYKLSNPFNELYILITEAHHLNYRKSLHKQLYPLQSRREPYIIINIYIYIIFGR